MVEFIVNESRTLKNYFNNMNIVFYNRQFTAFLGFGIQCQNKIMIRVQPFSSNGQFQNWIDGYKKVLFELPTQLNKVDRYESKAFTFYKLNHDFQHSSVTTSFINWKGVVNMIDENMNVVLFIHKKFISSLRIC